MTQKYRQSRKVERQIKNTPGTNCTPLRLNKYREVTFWRQWGHREVFRDNGTVEV